MFGGTAEEAAYDSGSEMLYIIGKDLYTYTIPVPYLLLFSILLHIFTQSI